MMRYLIACLVLLSSSTLVAQALHPCAELIWQDEFDGPSLDATKWTPQNGDGCPSLCGWGNNELQYYTDREENLKVSGGHLVITSRKENYNGAGYTSSKIRSVQKGDFTYGRIEARIKVPQGEGSWPAFWMLPTDEVYGSWPQSGEIDIMENQGASPTLASGTVHYGNPIPGNKYKSGISSLPGGANYYEDFHVFAIDWDSTSIKWYRDGTLFFTFTKDQTAPLRWPFDQRFHLILNNAVGGNLGGPVDDAFMPQTLEVDYVRVYSTPTNFNILGSKQVFAHADEQYYVPPVAGATDYQWQVPAGAVIASGQGTPAVTVTWGGSSSAGDVVLNVIKTCGTVNRTFTVKVLDDGLCNFVFDDMNGNKNITYDGHTSNFFNAAVNNPSKTGINTSTTSGYLYNNTSTAGNSFTISSFPFSDFSSYETGQRIFYFDSYTTADPNIPVEIRLINKSKAQGAYPAGVRAVLKAKTTLQSQWETLVFKFDHVADPTTLLSEVDAAEIVFSPQANVMAKFFYFDNIRRSLLPYNSINGNEAPASCDVSALSYSVTNNPSSTYQWSVPSGTTITSGQNTNQIIVNWGSVTQGKVNVTETNSGCTAITGSLDVKIGSCPTGILGASAVQGLTVYPNPSRDYITLEGELKQSSEVKVIVATSLGETVMTETYYEEAGSFSKRVSLQNMKAGTYMVQFITEQEVRAAKLIKY